MAKSYALIDTSIPTSKRPCITSLKLCVLCQVDTKAPLECPARSMRPTYGNGCTSLVEYLMQFKLLRHMSVTDLMMEMILRLYWWDIRHAGIKQSSTKQNLIDWIRRCHKKNIHSPWRHVPATARLTAKMLCVCFAISLLVLRVLILLSHVILGKYVNVHWNILTLLS